MTISIEDNIVAEDEAFGSPRSINETLNILIYEVGAVARNVIHAQSQTDEAVARAQYADALAELSDLVTQVGLMYLQLIGRVSMATAGLYSSFDELIQLGRERQLERMAEWEQRRTANTELRKAEGFFRGGLS